MCTRFSKCIVRKYVISGRPRNKYRSRTNIILQFRNHIIIRVIEYFGCIRICHSSGSRTWRRVKSLTFH